MIPYGRHEIIDRDIEAVVDALRSDFITQGSKVGEFESRLRITLVPNLVLQQIVRLLHFTWRAWHWA